MLLYIWLSIVSLWLWVLHNKVTKLRSLITPNHQELKIISGDAASPPAKEAPPTQEKSPDHAVEDRRAGAVRSTPQLPPAVEVRVERKATRGGNKHGQRSGNDERKCVTLYGFRARIPAQKVAVAKQIKKCLKRWTGLNFSGDPYVRKVQTAYKNVLPSVTFEVTGGEYKHIKDHQTQLQRYGVSTSPQQALKRPDQLQQRPKVYVPIPTKPKASRRPPPPPPRQPTVAAGGSAARQEGEEAIPATVVQVVEREEGEVVDQGADARRHAEKDAAPVVAASTENGGDNECEKDLRPCIVCGTGHEDQALILCEACTEPYHKTCGKIRYVPLSAWYCSKHDCQEQGRKDYPNRRWGELPAKPTAGNEAAGPSKPAHQQE